MSGSGKRWSGWGCRKIRDYQKEAGCKSFTNCLSFSTTISHQCFTEMNCIISNVCLWNVEELDGSLDTLKAAFEKATSEKLRCEDEVNCTNTTIQLANRLVKGLEVRLHWFRLLHNTYMFVEILLCMQTVFLLVFSWKMHSYFSQKMYAGLTLWLSTVSRNPHCVETFSSQQPSSLTLVPSQRDTDMSYSITSGCLTCVPRRCVYVWDGSLEYWYCLLLC